MNIQITKHAARRGRERLGMNLFLLRNASLKALNEGLDVFSDEYYRPIFMKKMSKYKNMSGVYYLDGAFFIFVEDRLVTVYNLDYLAGFKEI